MSKRRCRNVKLKGLSDTDERLFATTKPGYLWIGGAERFFATLTSTRGLRALHRQLTDLLAARSKA